MKITVEDKYYKPCSTCCDEDCLFKGTEDTHILCEDYKANGKSIPLAKVKQAREEIRKLDDINPDYPMDRTIHVSRNEVLEILDKLIAESKEWKTEK